jgi:hypothetical protein
LPHNLIRTLRLALATTALAAVIGPSVAAADEEQPMVALAPGAAMLEVGLPTPNSMISNGQTVDIGGWTTGSRVDVYLDGPAGVGRGIASTAVDRSRPDVARATGSSTLRSSGFDAAWMPEDLSAGPHALWIYSYADGVWTLQVVPIRGEGNVLISARDRDNDRATELNEVASETTSD